MNYSIDATGKSIGRLASIVASKLIGKDNTSFAKNIVSTNKVVVSNASKLKISEKKMLEKIYITYSGYPGGKKDQTLSDLIDKKGYSQVLLNAIDGMLPKNKLKKAMLKNLTITE